MMCFVIADLIDDMDYLEFLFVKHAHGTRMLVQWLISDARPLKLLHLGASSIQLIDGPYLHGTGMLLVFGTLLICTSYCEAAARRGCASRRCGKSPHHPAAATAACWEV